MNFKKCGFKYFNILPFIFPVSFQNPQVVYGRWLIDGYPAVILFDISSGAKHLEAWKNELYDLSRIAIPWHDREANDATIFGNLCTWFLAEVWISKQSKKGFL